MCGLAWRVRRPLQLETAETRGAKLEEGTVAGSFSSESNEEAPSCGVVGGAEARWRVCHRTFVADTGLGPEGSGLTADARRSQGSGAEDGFEGLAGSESLDRERARTQTFLQDSVAGATRVRRGCDAGATIFHKPSPPSTSSTLKMSLSPLPERQTTIKLSSLSCFCSFASFSTFSAFFALRFASSTA